MGHPYFLQKFALVTNGKLFYTNGMKSEIVFNVTCEADGGYCAEALGKDIFTQGDDWEELCANVREAVAAYEFDQPTMSAIRLRLVREEVLT